MKTTRYIFISTVLACVLAVTLFAAFGSKQDSISKAEQTNINSDIPVPSIAEIKAIAEEGFIYGLPIVMNYLVMYDYAGVPFLNAVFTRRLSNPTIQS